VANWSANALVHNGHDAEYDGFVGGATTCVELAVRDGIAKVGEGHAEIRGCGRDETTCEEGMEG